MKRAIGRTVRIAGNGVDETFPRGYAGRQGTIVGFDTLDHGATLDDPMYQVEFSDGSSDLFWPEEIAFGVSDTPLTGRIAYGL